MHPFIGKCGGVYLVVEKLQVFLDETDYLDQGGLALGLMNARGPQVCGPWQHLTLSPPIPCAAFPNPGK